MEYQKELDRIIARMNSVSENSEKYNELNIRPCELQGDKKRLWKAVKELQELTNELENKCNQDRDVEAPQIKNKHWYDLRNEILELLDKLGWKDFD